MRCYTLLTYLLLFSLAAHAQVEIEWANNYKLKPSDFQGSPSDTIPAEIYPDISIAYNLHTLHILRKNYNQNVSSHFSQPTSFYRSVDSTALEFARTVFDLSEVMARELRKEFTTHGRKVFSHKADETYKASHQKFIAMRSQYSTESEFGHNKEKQLYWQQWIALQLIELTPFEKYPSKTKALYHNGPPRYH